MNGERSGIYVYMYVYMYVYIYEVEYYSVIEKKEIMPFAAIWMYLHRVE